MQHLIDILLEKIKLQFPYHDRGDPAVPDFTLADFPVGGTWTEFDLSDIVPVDARCISVHFDANNSLLNRSFLFRQKGNVNEFNVAGLSSLGSAAHVYEDFTLSCCPDRKFEYFRHPSGWFTADFTVKGWWFGQQSPPAIVNRGDCSSFDFSHSDLINDSAWHPLDLSSIIPLYTSMVFILVRMRLENDCDSIRFRTHGNTYVNNRSECMAVFDNRFQFFDIQVPTSGLRVIDYWLNTGSFPIIEITVKAWAF